MRCPKCYTDNPDGALFCAACGGSMESAPAPDLSQPPYGAPAAPTYTTYDAPPAQNYPAQPGYNAQQPGGYQYGGVQNYGGQPQRGDASKNWAAILGLVLGILSFPCCFSGVYGAVMSTMAVSVIAVVIAVASVVFSIIGIKSQKRGLAIAGLVCGIIGFLATIYFLFALKMMIDSGMVQEIWESAMEGINV